MGEPSHNGLALDELLGAEVEELLGLSRQRINRLVQDGRLPARRLLNRWVFKLSDVRAFQQQPRSAGRPRKRTTP